MNSKPKVVVVLGPTASGKSDLAVVLSRKFDGEIISADSRQVYKGMNIGTGKITKREMRGIPHYLLDVASPKKVFTAEIYKRLAQKALRKILKNNKLPIVCGGTGHYIDALIYEQNFPAVAPDLKLRKRLEKKSVQELFAELKKLDPLRAKSIDPQNPRRLIRALEIIYKTGMPVPEMKNSSNYEFLKIGIAFPKDILKRRIYLRLIRRIKAGMINEVKKLLKSGVSKKRLEDFGLEYRYVSRFLVGKISRTQMIEQLENRIIDYSKRQMTWFKKDKEIRWVKNRIEAERLVKKFIAQAG